MEQPRQSKLYPVIKRGLDIVLSVLGLLAIWPVMLVIALLVRRDGGPAIYRQQRIGRNGVPFYLLKFRSMKPGAERLEDFLSPEELAEYRKEYKLVRDPRVSPIGMHLRRSSLCLNDEKLRAVCIRS